MGRLPHERMRSDHGGLPKIAKKNTNAALRPILHEFWWENLRAKGFPIFVWYVDNQTITLLKKDLSSAIQTRK